MTARRRTAPNPSDDESRFVVTGGPGAGKTTLLETLARRGYEHVPDSARAIIKERKAAGLSPRPAPDEFGWETLRLDVDAYRAPRPAHEPVFFDRSVVDALAFLSDNADISEAALRQHLEAFRYNETVFVLPPWEEIYRQDAERDQDFPHASRVHDRLCDWYGRCGYETVEVPRAPVEERVEFVLANVRVALGASLTGR